MSFAAASRSIVRAYKIFLKAISKYDDTDSGSQVSVEDFNKMKDFLEDYASLFAIFAFNVSHQKERLRCCSADIEIRRTLSANFGGHYSAYAMVVTDRYLN